MSFRWCSQNTYTPCVDNAVSTSTVPPSPLHGTVVCTTLPVKGAIIVKHVTLPPKVKENGRSMSDDCERTATVALPTASSPGFALITTVPLSHKTHIDLV